MKRPNNLNREYLADRIRNGYDVHVPGSGTIRNLAALPSQDELDKRLRKPAVPVAGPAGDTPAATTSEAAAPAAASSDAQPSAAAQATPAAASTAEQPPAPRTRRGGSSR